MNTPNSQVTEQARKVQRELIEWEQQMPRVWYGNRTLLDAHNIIEDLLAAIEAALTARTEASTSAEDRFEQYVATLIDKNPDVRRLGECLADWLDEDRFNTVEPMLVGIAAKLSAAAAPPAAEEGFVVPANEVLALRNLYAAPDPSDEPPTEHDLGYEQACAEFVQHLDAMLAARPQPAQGDGWLPIESAPRDGTPFLACRLATGGWEKSWTWPATVVWASYHPNASGKECWRTSPVCGNKAEAVTHWRPLPPPPAPADGGGK